MRLTMVGRLSECLLFSYSTPEPTVRHLVPGELQLVTHRGRAFWNIVISTIQDMRPAGFPRWSGITYQHVAYRLYVRANPAQGDPIRGLYFLRSDVNSPLIWVTGNPLTDFRFHRANILIVEQGERIKVKIASTAGSIGNAEVTVSLKSSEAVTTGLFGSPDEQEQLLKYQPLGISIGRHHRIRLAEVVRDESRWSEKPIAVEAARWNFLGHLRQNQITLERATRVAALDYEWRLGGRLCGHPPRKL